MERSRLPYVLGLFAIMFSIAGAVSTAMSYREALASSLGIALGAASLVVAALHLYGGWKTAQYQAVGLRVLTGYAIAALALAMAELWLGERKSLALIVAKILGMAWPLVVLVLANTKRAEEACRPVVSDG